MELAITIVFILYFGLVTWLMIGWRRVMWQSNNKEDKQPRVSVVVPVRNEAHNILHLLKSLEKQTYLNFEILIVNDHSTDDTLAVVSQVTSTNDQMNSRVQVLTCTIQAGKKAALTLGIEKAKGEIIITTDADCTMPNEWLQVMVNQFAANTMLVVGGVRISSHNFFSKLQQLEFASLIGSGAATLSWGIPTMANGANLAFKKIAFEKVGGYTGNDHIASGDDEFLLRKIHAAYGGAVVFSAHPLSVVETKSANSISEFLQQRFRWAGKWKLHTSWFSKLLAASIFVFQCVFLLLPWLVLIGSVAWQIGLLLFLTKALIEYLFFKPIIKQLGIRFSTAAFFTLQFVYPYYVVCVALLANFKGYTWKGRKH